MTHRRWALLVVVVAVGVYATHYLQTVAEEGNLGGTVV